MTLASRAPTATDKRVGFPTDFPYDKQGVPVPGTKRPGQTAHYRNGYYGLYDLDTPLHLKTLTEVFDIGLSQSKDKPFLGHRPLVSTNPLKFADQYKWQTYAQIDARRRHLGSALYKWFSEGVLGGGELETVGIWSQNRPEWQVVELACNAYNKVSVSLYDTLGKDSVEYIINHSHLTIIFAASTHIPTLLKLVPKTPHLRVIVSMDDLQPETLKILADWGETCGIKVSELRELEKIGQASPVEPMQAVSSQLATICYTSGTTNLPKGVLLTHGNLGSAAQANLFANTIAEAEGRLLSYLPLAHIYERVMELTIIGSGGCIGYFTGDPLRLLEDAQILKPNFFPSVPRVLNRIYQAAMAAGNVPGMKGALFNKAVQAKLERLRTTGDASHAFWNRLVFRKVQAVLGGQILLLTSGSAPINAEVMDHLKIFFGGPGDVIEGYGMTENCGTCTRTWPGDRSSSGTVGSPQPVCELKLIDVPAMKYTAEDKPNPRGELCVRGANCFTAYYKDEKNTKETVDSEGWVHTGDVAEIDSCGRFKIIDRVKNIMKLAQGEYVALEKIEGLYAACPIVAQLFVHGDSLQSYLIAVIVPDPAQLSTIASKVWGQKVTVEDGASLLKATRDPKVASVIMKMLTGEAKKNQLKGFEQIKRIHVTLDPFTVDDGTLTPTLKIRRKDAYAKHQTTLDGLYALGEPSSAEGTKL